MDVPFTPMDTCDYCPTTINLKKRSGRRRKRCKDPVCHSLQLRELHLKCKYGISLGEFDALLADQDFFCGICGKAEYISGREFSVDHDHQTGQVRGILCSECNILIGKAKEDVAVLKAAIRYLERYL